MICLNVVAVSHRYAQSLSYGLFKWKKFQGLLSPTRKFLQIIYMAKHCPRQRGSLELLSALSEFLNSLVRQNTLEGLHRKLETYEQASSTGRLYGCGDTQVGYIPLPSHEQKPSAYQICGPRQLSGHQLTPLTSQVPEIIEVLVCKF